MSFRPKAGMRCVTRSGLITTPIQDDGPEFLFPIAAEVGGKARLWAADGQYLEQVPHPLDLISEYVEAPAIAWADVRAAVREAA